MTTSRLRFERKRRRETSDVRIEPAVISQAAPVEEEKLAASHSVQRRSYLARR